MNKKFFSLLLIVSMGVSISSFATEEKKEAPKSNIPENVSTDIKLQESILAQREIALENSIKARDEEVKKGDKQDKNAVDKLDKEIIANREAVVIQKCSVNALKNYVKETYEQTTLDKITAPMTKVANFLANNVKAAFAVEAVAVVAATCGIYNWLFASQEDEEEDFQ